MMRAACVLFLVIGFASLAPGQDKPKTGFVEKTFKNADDKTSPYVVFVPHRLRRNEGISRHPVPARGRRDQVRKEGHEDARRSRHRPGDQEAREDFPFIVVIPQAEGFGWGATTANAKRALSMLDEVMKEYKVDPKRQYLTGLSMGGMGTWSIAMAHPDRFAAIVPICGRGDVKTAEKIKDLPCWAFHGDADTSVNVSGSRDMIEAIKKAGGNPKYTEYPKVGHNSWDKAYGTDELYEWLLEQKKK